MSAAENLVGKTLTGSRTGLVWTVQTMSKVEEGLTPGQFSFCYEVVDSDGRNAFLKAADLGMFTRRGAGTLQALQMAINAHQFERTILDHCRGNNMDKVVTALDYGEVEVVHHAVRDTVFFLIFEMASGDLRKHVVKQQTANLLWCVTALHNFFIATRQLHGALVAHNDIKPANTLVFDDTTHKIADLGRATCNFIQGDHYGGLCVGDPQYAPPEQLYPQDRNCEHLPDQVKRFAGDLYNLGSITHYLLTARSVTTEIIPMLRPEQRPRNMSGGSQGSYQSALPYWRNAFADLISLLKETTETVFGLGVKTELALLLEIVEQLCEPDPMLRGHPKNRSPTQNRYGLERYITGLNMAKERLAIKAA